jgi:tetratricopeptide (TPR) repeat protein
MMTWILCSVLLLVQPDLETAKTARQEGRFDEAIASLEQILAAQPELVEARLELGHTLTLSGRYREAIDSYEKLAQSSNPRWKVESARWSGRTQLYLGAIDNSLKGLAELAEAAQAAEDPSARVQATWYRGHIETELHRFGEANEAFLEALELDPNDLNALHLAGVMAARQGDTGSLRYQIEDLQKAVGKSRETSQMRRVHHLQAELALLQERPKSALSQIDKAIELFPHPLYRETKARAHLALDEPAAAESVYREIVTASDERLDIPLSYIMSLLGLARTLDAQDKSEEAAEYFKKFLAHWENDSLPGVGAAKSRLTELGVSP